MANIEYKRLSHAWATVVDALNFLIGNINKDATWGVNKFITTDGSGKMTAQTGWATSVSPQASGTGEIGTVNEVARRDHYHPNTCPTPTLPTDLVDKNYVDNVSKVSASLGGIPDSMNLTANTPVNITYNGVVCAATTGVTVFTNNYFRIDKSGRYRVSFFGSYTSSSAADISAVITIDGTDTYIGSKGTRAGSPALIVSGGANGILDLVATNAVSVRIMASANTTIVHSYAGFSIESV